MKSKLFRKTLLIFILVLTIGCSILGVWTSFSGILDAVPGPCPVYFDEQSSCIQSYTENGWDYLDKNQYARIQVFLTFYEIHYAGGFCNHEYSNNDRLNVLTSALNLEFEREGDTLKVNGKSVPTGGEFTYTKFWNLNPWTVFRLEFQNNGLRSVCGSSAPSAIYVDGSYGSDISLAKAGIVLVISIAVVFGFLYFLPINKTKSQ